MDTAILTTGDKISKKLIGRKFIGRSIAAQVYNTSYYDKRTYTITADDKGRLRATRPELFRSHYPYLGSILKPGEITYCPFRRGQFIRADMVDANGKFSDRIENAELS